MVLYSIRSLLGLQTVLFGLLRLLPTRRRPPIALKRLAACLLRYDGYSPRGSSQSLYRIRRIAFPFQASRNPIYLERKPRVRIRRAQREPRTVRIPAVVLRVRTAFDMIPKHGPRTWFAHSPSTLSVSVSPPNSLSYQAHTYGRICADRMSHHPNIVQTTSSALRQTGLPYFTSPIPQ